MLARVIHVLDYAIVVILLKLLCTIRYCYNSFSYFEHLLYIMCQILQTDHTYKLSCMYINIIKQNTIIIIYISMYI